MKLTVLGLYAPYAPAGGATSGYLVEAGGRRLLLDCGSGVLARLQRFARLDDIETVVLTHLHGDHIADMTLLRYALPYNKRFGTGERDRVTVFAPPEPAAEYELLRAMKPFDLTPVSHGMRAQAAGMELEFVELSHPYPVFGVRVTCGGRVLAYTGDTVMCEAAAQIAAGADLLLCDSSFLEADRTGESTHMSAAQAAMLARDSGAKRLLLTHRLAHYGGWRAHLKEARAIFRNARLACELKTYTV